MINQPIDVVQDTINRLFKPKTEDDTDILFSIINLILLKNSNNMDMAEMYKNTDLSTFIKVLSLFDDRTVKFMKMDEFTDTLILAMVYFYRNVEGKSWDEIQEYFGTYKLNKTSLSNKIYYLEFFIKVRMNAMFSKLENPDETRND